MRLLLPVSSRARAPHSLPTPARAFLLTPNLAIALCANKKREKLVEEAGRSQKAQDKTSDEEHE